MITAPAVVVLIQQPNDHLPEALVSNTELVMTTMLFEALPPVPLRLKAFPNRPPLTMLAPPPETSVPFMAAPPVPVLVITVPVALVGALLNVRWSTGKLFQLADCKAKVPWLTVVVPLNELPAPKFSVPVPDLFTLIMPLPSVTEPMRFAVPAP